MKTVDEYKAMFPDNVICKNCKNGTLRVIDGADTFTGNACFLEFDFHFEKDTVGSKTELVK